MRTARCRWIRRILGENSSPLARLFCKNFGRIRLLWRFHHDVIVWSRRLGFWRRSCCRWCWLRTRSLRSRGTGASRVFLRDSVETDWLGALKEQYPATLTLHPPCHPGLYGRLASPGSCSCCAASASAHLGASISAFLVGPTRLCCWDRDSVHRCRLVVDRGRGGHGIWHDPLGRDPDCRRLLASADSCRGDIVDRRNRVRSRRVVSVHGLTFSRHNKQHKVRVSFPNRTKGGGTRKKTQSRDLAVI
jgi:hypothetical protein